MGSEIGRGHRQSLAVKTPRPGRRARRESAAGIVTRVLDSIPLLATLSHAERSIFAASMEMQRFND